MGKFTLLFEIQLIYTTTYHAVYIWNIDSNVIDLFLNVCLKNDFRNIKNKFYENLKNKFQNKTFTTSTVKLYICTVCLSICKGTAGKRININQIYMM